ncbi:MAG: type II secretion system protein GspF, partial [Deltaproteobacteria bacterium]|nr:type II secretion system protein GspF [Deltaproteobacteria bacterium]
MTLFSYKAADQTGKIVTGTQDAPDEKGVVAALQAQGYIPIRVASTVKAPSHLSLRWGKGLFGLLNRVSDKDILRFTEDLATLLGSGVTLDRSLQILRDAADKQALKA